MKKTFLVVYEKGKKNYGGFAPDVPGCGSMGNTLEEVRANLREALQLYMDTSAELGFPLPDPTTSTVTLPIEGETDPKVTYVVERLTLNIPRPRTSTPRPSTAKLAKTKRRALQAA